MGFVGDTSEARSFDEIKKHIPKVREDAITQFLLLIKKFANIVSEDNTWGDETEFHIVHLDKTSKRARVCLESSQLVPTIKDESIEAQCEFGSWMIEAIPKNPFNIGCDPEEVRRNIQARRKSIEKYLHPDEFVLTCPIFPLLGVGDFYHIREAGFKQQHSAAVERALGLKTALQGLGEKSELFESSQMHCENYITSSMCVPDYTINRHTRYVSSARNILLRRGEKIHITVPIYKDENTSFEPNEDEPLPGCIYMDAILFGMGNCCLQQTFSAKNYHAARYLYDQLAIISPLVLTLSAASPIFKGKLSDIDTRWNVASQGVDDRTAGERDVKSNEYIPKSRYDSISFYISNDPVFKEKYNDYDFPVNKRAINFGIEKAEEIGVELDNTILQHLGFLMLRDPLVIFSDKLEVDVTKSFCHFEIIQSMNWNSVRFKPPPSFDSNIPWRVELRTCELQTTDEENTAFNIFALLMNTIIQTQKLNFYIPMSKLQENFLKAQKRDAVTKELFWFRKDFSYNSPDDYVQLTLHEFLVGKKDEYQGIMSAIEKYFLNAFKSKDCELAKSHKKYIIEHIIKRASGEEPTPAKWMRDFVLKHPLYNKDSVVSQEIGFDLINAIRERANGTQHHTIN